MRKILVFILVFAVLFMFLIVPASSADEIELVLNGVESDIITIKAGGEQFVPLRAVCKNMGGNITWNDAKRSADVVIDGHSLSIFVDSKKVFINGQEEKEQWTVRIVNETLMVPLRLLENAFGFESTLESQTNKLYIRYAPTVEPLITSEYPIVIVPGTMGCWSSVDFKGIKNQLQKNAGNSFADAAFTLIKPFLVGMLDSIESVEKSANSYYVTETNGKTYYVEPFWDTYVPLCQYLKENGLKQDEDYFIFGYDTLNVSIEDNASELGTYIDTIKKQTGALKVQLIAHSQGGLVAREYIQNDGGYLNISKLMGVSVPNHGVAYTYPLCEKGSFNPLDGREMSVSMLAYFAYGDFSNASKKKYVEEQTKTIKQMVPTYFDTGEVENKFLKQLNSEYSMKKLNFIGKENVIMFMGSGIETIARYDKNGNPITNINGDGTVLVSSGVLDGEYKTVLIDNTRHTEPFKRSSIIYDYINLKMK